MLLSDVDWVRAMDSTWEHCAADDDDDDDIPATELAAAAEEQTGVYEGDLRDKSSTGKCTDDGRHDTNAVGNSTPLNGGVGVRTEVHKGEMVLWFGSARRAFLHATELITSGLDVLPSRPQSAAEWSGSPTFTTGSLLWGRRSDPKNFFLKCRS